MSYERETLPNSGGKVEPDDVKPVTIEIQSVPNGHRVKWFEHGVLRCQSFVGIEERGETPIEEYVISDERRERIAYRDPEQ